MNRMHGNATSRSINVPASGVDTKIAFARRIFQLAGIYGFLIVTPMYFLEGFISRNLPPPITHPENYYGFIGLARAWQIDFIVISQDVVRFWPLMPIAIVEKLSFSLPVVILYLNDRTSGLTLGMACLDLFIGAMFAAAYLGLHGKNSTTKE